jgi:hypothetical protein
MNYKGLLYMTKEVILLSRKVISFTAIQAKRGCLKKTTSQAKTKKNYSPIVLFDSCHERI